MNIRNWLGFSSARTNATKTPSTTSATITSSPSSSSSPSSQPSSPSPSYSTESSSSPSSQMQRQQYQHQHQHQPALVIGTSKPKTPPRSPNNPQKRKPTKSDELLADKALLKFFVDIDTNLQNLQLLKPNEIEKLELVGYQANLDECEVLMDIVDYFEGKHLKNKCILQQHDHIASGSNLNRQDNNHHHHHHHREGIMEIGTQQEVC